MKKFVEYVFLTFGASIVAMGLETMLAPNGLVDAEAATIEFTEEDLIRIDQVFPKPTRKMPLDVI
ncbi:hypothetical protein [Priestia megaterium]|uniref:hypothetical protein n=1 Tax=Priestia megaterium TaxID=1404 RepID=UPI00351AEB15